MNTFDAFNYIDAFYAGSRANRSGVPKINHIREGLAYLTRMGASEECKIAWCLHPIFQMDDVIVETQSRDLDIPLRAVIYVMEYRSIANGFLSGKRANPYQFETPTKSVLSEVNLMLRVDKMQNRKDFEAHLYGNIENSEELRVYFAKWFRILEITEPMYAGFQDCVRAMK